MLTVRSQPGDGSTFVVWLPFDDTAESVAITSDGIHHDIDPFEENASIHR